MTQTGGNTHPHESTQEDLDEDAGVLLAALRGQLRQFVPGGGEQYLDRYLSAVGVTPLEAVSVLRRWADHLDGGGYWLNILTDMQHRIESQS